MIEPIETIPEEIVPEETAVEEDKALTGIQEMNGVAPANVDANADAYSTYYNRISAAPIPMLTLKIRMRCSLLSLPRT